MSSNLEVVVGTYEQFLLGYTVDDIVNKYKMEQSFATHSHLASIRSVASAKHYLASAAADDTVCLYNMNTRLASGKLVHHNDTVNSISFTPDGSHIMTASSDGTIGIVRCGNWQLEKHWLKPHKGLSVNTLAIHPTGKIAMTTGHDGVLRTWNLVKGRQAYATNLVPRWKLDAKSISVLKWSPSGNSYLIAANNRIDIYSVETAGVEEEISFETKVVSVEYLNDEFVAIGLADGKICIYDLENGTKTELEAHKTRVKCLAYSGELLFSGSSSGEIKVWSFEKDKLTLLNEINCNARISCMTLTFCSNLKENNTEVKVEEEATDSSISKLRLRQQVIIEEEDESKFKKSKKNKNKARKLPDDENSENMLKTKKIKTQESKEPPKKIKRDASNEPIQKTKKMKVKESPKKRKESEVIELEQSELVKKKKKTKENVEVNTEEKNVVAKDDKFNLKKKKRKNIQESKANNSTKKTKIVEEATISVLPKKKKKKNFKNKIQR